MAIRKKGTICFDMDGTIADLYNVPNWLEKLREENYTPYLEAAPLCNMKELREILLKLRRKGWEIRVITWLAKDSSPHFKEMARIAKLAWLIRHKFPYDKAHLVAYGTTKAKVLRGDKTTPAILIDDNKKVRNGWHLGFTIDPTICDIITELRKLL